VPIFNSIASWLMIKRMNQIELFMRYPLETQDESFFNLIDTARDTEWGKKFDYTEIHSVDTFKERVPLQDYDSLKPYIERLRRGEQNILWPSEIKRFAKSSGTTSDKSKFIPVSEEALELCHYRGGKDMLSIHCNNFPESQLFTGKNLGLGGSRTTDIFSDHESIHGDVSALIIHDLPLWAEFLRLPSIEIALMNEWEEKLEKMALATMNENITSLAGVPSWMMVLLKRVLELKKKKYISEVWPNLEVYFHGGVNFGPYREQYRELFGPSKVRFLELYNASEGFFGMQDQGDSNELLLMLDYGIYYEFLSVENLGNPYAKTLSLDEVEIGKNYALIISTNAGLWRYMIGDTIRFTSLFPFRFHITGRTRSFINAFGEEVIIENAEKALSIACEKTNARIRDYTAAPVYFEENQQGAHEWLIEFEHPPENMEYFNEVLDNALKSINSDYEAKRYQNMVLRAPIIKSVPSGTFYAWLKTKNKLGGQYKVPRLCNDRLVLEEIVSLIP
jgi:hypothetical protein